MTQIKFFNLPYSDLIKLEVELNNWLDENDDIKVLDIKYQSIGNIISLLLIYDK